ncbi:DUF1653 domain-containing protein [Candidatus Woesearchaeota archaeon]|nr:DUF1653 domain-containing protein [Candidatus Woesearchaeota archaeon]
MEKEGSDEVEVAEKKIKEREKEEKGQVEAFKKSFSKNSQEKNEEDLGKEIKEGKYRHYKGNFYHVLGVARHSETLEEFVVYKALYENEFGKNCFWIRPKKMFLETVNKDGRILPRFEFVGK